MSSSCCLLTSKPARVLRDVNQFAERRSSRKGITRFFTHKSDACEIAEYREKLKQAMDVVSVCPSPLYSSENV